jgi:hypothetical protein
VGHGDQQIRTEYHATFSITVKERFEGDNRILPEGVKQFFKLFKESTLEGSRAVAQSMKKFANRQTKPVKEGMIFHSLYFLVHHSDSEMLSWPNSPLLVLLQFVDPIVLSGDLDARLQEGEPRETPLHHLAHHLDPFDYSTHVNQLILAKQLIEHGANINAVSNPHGKTPLHYACFEGNVTNLDFIEYLLEEGADPNAQEITGLTPLMHTIPNAPGAAKFLLNWPATDANITSRSGDSFQNAVRRTVKHLSDQIALPDNLDRVQLQYVFQQWRGIEEMLVLAERGAADTGITPFE